MEMIAQRELTYRDDTGEEHPFKVLVGTPREDSGCWVCDYEIGGPAPFCAAAYGEDSLQALVMALHAVQAHLKTPALRDRVRWLGEPAAAILELPAV